jgi:nucleoside 2-deoxyribosyltransferase
MTTNILNKTKCYLIGSIEYGDGKSWRVKIKTHLQSMGITVLDPYDKPFITAIDEGENTVLYLKSLIKLKKYSKVGKIVKKLRSYDLSMVDKSDFVIFYINPLTPTFGSVEELTTAVRMKKPTFIFVEGGKKNCPIWFFGMIPHKYIYNSMEGVLDVIKKIDSGKIPIDNSRWRLFREEYR